VVFTSAKTGAGIAELLDVIVRLLPNPTEGNAPVYVSTPAAGGAPSPESGRCAPACCTNGCRAPAC
jgi:elongation factor G